MGFTKEEVRRLNFKVQAGNVIDADAGNYWYQALLENQPSVKPNRILAQFPTVAANPPANFNALVTSTQGGGALNGVVGDEFTATSTRLTILTAGLENTYVAYNTYNTASSGRKDFWISPVAVRLANGNPSLAYGI